MIVHVARVFILFFPILLPSLSYSLFLFIFFFWPTNLVITIYFESMEINKDLYSYTNKNSLWG